jgi:hypothetical protein
MSTFITDVINYYSESRMFMGSFLRFRASRQPLRKNPINIVYLRLALANIRTHFSDEPPSSILQRSSNSKAVALLFCEVCLKGLLGVL